jgi:hypothetical protein
VHFEVTSDLLLEREIEPIFHFEKHLNIFTVRKETRKVYFKGVGIRIFEKVLCDLT